MIITFNEKDGKKYEVQSDHVEKIFDDVKEKMVNILAGYEDNEENLLIAATSLGSVANVLLQMISDKIGADKVIEMLGAVPMENQED